MGSLNTHRRVYIDFSLGVVPETRVSKLEVKVASQSRKPIKSLETALIDIIRPYTKLIDYDGDICSWGFFILKCKALILKICSLF